MCRLAIYMGHPIILSKFVTEPKNSIIKQSSAALQEKQLQLNGDGFGIAWYSHDITPLPAVFTETSPAWSNKNLLELSKITKSSCILTHVRQASPGLPVVSTNCHPFTYKKFAFMHNGYVENFKFVKRRLINMLSEDIYNTIQGSTDSEHLFGLFLEFYRRMKSEFPTKEKKLERMAGAISKVITTIECISEEVKLDKEHSSTSFTHSLNLVVSDGDRIVATRFTSGATLQAHTMFYCTGKHFHCHPTTGDVNVEAGRDVEVTEHNQEEAHDQMVIIASEPLTNDQDFKPIEPNYMVVADRKTIGLKSIEELRLVHIPNMEPQNTKN